MTDKDWTTGKEYKEPLLIELSIEFIRKKIQKLKRMWKEEKLIQEFNSVGVQK